jgi:hypothetical protein
MVLEDFVRRFEFVHRMTLDFARAVPDDKWHFSPDPGSEAARRGIVGRHGDGFAPFSKQLRHVICVRGVYTDALNTRRADFARKHSHYSGPLDRAALLAALGGKRADLLAALENVDVEARIDFFGTPFTFGDFAYTVVQHEAIHHGQWSIYASLAGFETPRSWRMEWGL